MQIKLIFIGFAPDSCCFCKISLALTRRPLKYNSDKPWRNEVARYRKFGKANLRTRTCVGWPNGLSSWAQVTKSDFDVVLCERLILVTTILSKVPRVKRRTSHEPNLIQMRKISNVNINLLLKDVNLRESKLGYRIDELFSHHDDSQLNTELNKTA